MDQRDARFGRVSVAVDRRAGLVEVSGDGVPRVLLRRRQAGLRWPRESTGARDDARLDLLVDGRRWQVAPARAGLTRRSHRVDARRGDVHLRLVPSTTDRSTLLRDGRVLGRFRVVSADGAAEGTGAGVSARWRASAAVEPADAAVGYALAAAFGTGARPWVVGFVGNLLRT